MNRRQVAFILAGTALAVLIALTTTVHLLNAFGV